MNSVSPNGKGWRFGAFEVDFHAGLVRKHGVRIRVQQQPLKVLGALLERPGEMVTREELRHGISGNLCRCQDYDKILTAMMRGAELMRGA